MPSITMMTLNAQGTNGELGLRSLLGCFQKNKKKMQLGVVLIQEHNLARARANTYKELAKAMGFTLEISSDCSLKRYFRF